MEDTIHFPGGMELDRIRFQQTTQNSVQFKIYELFVSEIFHKIFSDHADQGQLKP
jgi:hypothetical protein